MATDKKRGGRVDLASLVGAVGDNSSVDGLVEGQFRADVALDELASNPRNPRDGVGDLSDLESIRTKQLQPATVVSRARWLKLWPDDTQSIGDARYIVVTGNRRLAAARHYGRHGLDVVVRDSLADSRETVVWAAIVENIDRSNLDILEEAQAIEQLVAELGSAGAVAKCLNRSEGWVSQRRALLKLDPTLREKIRSGELAFREARDLAKLPPAAQLERWRASLAAAEGDVATKPDNSTNGGVSTPRDATPKTAVRALKRLSAPPQILAEALVEVLSRDELVELLRAVQETSEAED